MGNKLGSMFGFGKKKPEPEIEPEPASGEEPARLVCFEFYISFLVFKAGTFSCHPDAGQWYQMRNRETLLSCQNR